ncbi:hypothetical protein F0562_001222 [Nyssa sinensis]|uniref:PTM/DIR17-like Tudor domain-containing protein n=1 Tax=Nyssa sinensis TaxID=561372 RepID=A0A5J5C717_9ASTE|nr:hypothetical protein F0562_001222 [Nyssa sinensis]
MENKESMQLGGNKTKGEISTAETSHPRGGIEMEKGKRAAKIKVAVEQNADTKTPMKRKQSADGEIAQAYLSSLERGLSRLRPRKEFRSYRMVELSEDDNTRIVGTRVKVYWSGSRKWFLGSIKSFDMEKGLHKILYDDGDKEELDLRKERFELEIKPSDGFTLRTEPHSKKKVKVFDVDKVSAGAETLTAESVKVEYVEQLKGNTEPEKNKASKKKKAVKRRSSKSQMKKDNEDKKRTDLVSEMDVDMLPEKVEEAIPYEVHDVGKAGHVSLGKRRDECKILTEIAGVANESSGLITESNCEKPKLASNGFEETVSATTGVTDGTNEVSLDFLPTMPGNLVEEEKPEILLKTLKIENNESAGDTSQKKKGILEGGMKTSPHALHQLADYQNGNDEIRVDCASQQMGLCGGNGGRICGTVTNKKA